MFLLCSHRLRYESHMWAATKNTIASECDISEDNLQTLERAAADAFSYESISFREIHKALDYFYARVNRMEGVHMYQRGLREKNPEYMHEGVKLLRKNLGRQ